MNSFHITTGIALQTYIQESLAYSCLIPEAKAQWTRHALVAWYVPLLQAGYTGIPFFAVLDLGGRIGTQGQAFSFSSDAAPDNGLFHRYARALDAFCRKAGIRDVMADITMHRRDPGIVMFLKRILRPVLVQSSALVSIDREALDQVYTMRVYGESSSSDRAYHLVIESFIESFARMTLDKQADPSEIPVVPSSAMPDYDRRLVLGVAMQEHALSYPDMELIDRCMRMDDLPELPSHGQESVMRTLHMIRLEQPMTRSTSPESGYIGIRNNGSVEDLTNPVMSEWANPVPVLWEKLTNRNLLIYERASRTIHVRRMLLHLLLLNHSSLLQIDPENDCLPIREMKYLMASISRDLALYLGQMRSVDVSLNLHLAGNSGAMVDIRSVNLTDITPDRIRYPRHFLLDERDIFPWFFSSDLCETPAFVSLPTGDAQQNANIDLMEECLPERDIMFGEYSIGFENIHCFLFCTEEQHRIAGQSIIDHMRNYLDLGPTSLDSLVFIVLTDTLSPSPIWRIEPVHQYHREFDPTRINDDAPDHSQGNLLMSDFDVRNTIRRYFLARLLGMRFRERVKGEG